MCEHVWSLERSIAMQKRKLQFPANYSGSKQWYKIFWSVSNFVDVSRVANKNVRLNSFDLILNSNNATFVQRDLHPFRAIVVHLLSFPISIETNGLFKRQNHTPNALSHQSNTDKTDKRTSQNHCSTRIALLCADKSH